MHNYVYIRLAGNMNKVGYEEPHFIQVLPF
jgi:hypothetical protein